MSILEVQHIEKHFGATRVLNDISFSLEKGQALSIIGEYVHITSVDETVYDDMEEDLGIQM